MARVIRLHNEAVQLRAELDRVRKEFATFVLEVSALEHDHDIDVPCVRDDGVGALMHYFRHDIGECSRCKCRAPLEGGVCAWGCSP